MKANALKDVDAILSVSNTTADDLVRFFPHLKSRVYIAQNGADHFQTPTTKRPLDNSRPYCLFVGARGSYKNFGCLVEAVGSSTWPSQLSVRVAGSEFSRHELKLIRQFGIEDRLECVGRVSDEELCRLYQAAQFFVFPSAAEGFGLPTLESQVNGCLAVVSDLPVFREVAGKGALFFDPWAPETLAQVANTALDEKVREATVRLGNDNVQRFSWDHAAEVTLRCYRELHAKRWA